MEKKCKHSLGHPAGIFWTSLEVQKVSPQDFIAWLENLSSNTSNKKQKIQHCSRCKRWYIEGKVEIENWFWKDCFNHLKYEDIRFTVPDPDCSHKQFKLRFEYLYYGRRYVYGDDNTCDLAVGVTTVHECTDCGVFLFGDGTISQRPEERGEWEGYYDLYLAPGELYPYILRKHKVPEEEWKNEPITKTDGGWYMPRD